MWLNRWCADSQGMIAKNQAIREKVDGLKPQLDVMERRGTSRNVMERHGT